MQRNSAGAPGAGGGLSGEGPANGATSGTARGGIGMDVNRSDAVPGSASDTGAGATSGAAAAGAGTAHRDLRSGANGAAPRSGVPAGGPGSRTTHAPAETTSGPASAGPR
jgi:hypothetical protein